MTTCAFTPCDREATPVARNVRLANSQCIDAPACDHHARVTNWTRNEPDVLDMIPPARWEESEVRSE